MLALPGNWAYVCRLQHWPNFGAGNCAVPAVGVQHHCLEGLLPESVWRESRVAEYRPVDVPGLAEVDLDLPAEDQLHQVAEVPRIPGIGHLIAFAVLDDAREVRWRLERHVVGEERDVPDENTPDHRVLVGRQPLPAVVLDAVTHFREAGDAVGRA